MKEQGMDDVLLTGGGIIGGEEIKKLQKNFAKFSLEFTPGIFI